MNAPNSTAKKAEAFMRRHTKEILILMVVVLMGAAAAVLVIDAIVREQSERQAQTTSPVSACESLDGTWRSGFFEAGVCVLPDGTLVDPLVRQAHGG